MGCGSSLSAEFQAKYTASIQLSAAQKKIVRETWEFVEQRMSYVGKRMFLKFFENNPEYKRLFPEFKDLSLSDIEKTKELHGHAKRVMKALENAVSAMDDAEIFAAYLDELGRRHKDRPMKPLHLDSVKTALIFTLQELFKSSWTEETAEAWNKLFMFIRDQMVRGLQSRA
ncbi:globin-1-like [Porites lutea]|uniref:globin-1-like n=1 Tax=Porites lutea TaxID=51062 RepID=UPI003CC51A6F